MTARNKRKVPLTLARAREPCETALKPCDAAPEPVQLFRSDDACQGQCRAILRLQLPTLAIDAANNPEHQRPQPISLQLIGDDIEVATPTELAGRSRGIK